MASLIHMFCGRKRASDVWKYFLYDEQKRRSVCQIELSNRKTCSVSVATKNPTNLKNHLKNHHRAEYEDLMSREAEETAAKKQRMQAGIVAAKCY